MAGFPRPATAHRRDGQRVRSDELWLRVLCGRSLPWRFFTEIFFGGALADGMTTGDRTHLALGCDLLFHVGGSVGYGLTQNWHAMVTFDHISNGNVVFGTNCDRYQGLNNYGARWSEASRA